MSPIRRHLTYANVMATLAALVVLVGGTAYAANQLAKNSVGKKQLKAKSVTAAKIKKNAVTTAKIKKNAVTAGKVKAASLGDAKLSSTVPFTRVVAEIRGSSPVSLPSEPGDKYVVYPLNGRPTPRKRVGPTATSATPTSRSRRPAPIRRSSPSSWSTRGSRTPCR